MFCSMIAINNTIFRFISTIALIAIGCNIIIIFFVICVFEFFIGSGTAKAFLVMPLVLPLAHLIGLSSNSVVLSFCLADGFTNLLYPTSGIMIIAIGLVGVSYIKWLRFSWPLFVIEGIISVAVMMLAVFIGYR